MTDPVLTAYRDATLFKVIYAYGLRARNRPFVGASKAMVSHGNP